MTNTTEQNGVFTTSQDELTQAVYDELIYKPRVEKEKKLKFNRVERGLIQNAN